MTERMRDKQPSHHHNDKDSQKEDPAAQGFELKGSFSRHYNGQSNIATPPLHPREKQLKYKKTPPSLRCLSKLAQFPERALHTDEEKRSDARHCEKRR